jgi:hypothetical protein
VGASRRRRSRRSYFADVAAREARAGEEARLLAERAAHVEVLADILEQLAVEARDAAAVTRAHRVLVGVGGRPRAAPAGPARRTCLGARPISDEALAFHARGLVGDSQLGGDALGHGASVPRRARPPPAGTSWRPGAACGVHRAHSARAMSGPAFVAPGALVAHPEGLCTGCYRELLLPSRRQYF